MHAWIQTSFFFYIYRVEKFNTPGFSFFWLQYIYIYLTSDDCQKDLIAENLRAEFSTVFRFQHLYWGANTVKFQKFWSEIILVFQQNLVKFE